jgi:hypothetical protein
MREKITTEQAHSMNEMANTIVASLMDQIEPPMAMTVLGMVCAKLIFSFTRDKNDFDEICDTLNKQIQSMIAAEEADGNICWEKAE